MLEHNLLTELRMGQTQAIKSQGVAVQESGSGQSTRISVQECGELRDLYNQVLADVLGLEGVVPSGSFVHIPKSMAAGALVLGNHLNVTDADVRRFSVIATNIAKADVAPEVFFEAQVKRAHASGYPSPRIDSFLKKGAVVLAKEYAKHGDAANDIARADRNIAPEDEQLRAQAAEMAEAYYTKYYAEQHAVSSLQRRPKARMVSMKEGFWVRMLKVALECGLTGPAYVNAAFKTCSVKNIARPLPGTSYLDSKECKAAAKLVATPYLRLVRAS